MNSQITGDFCCFFLLKKHIAPETWWKIKQKFYVLELAYLNAFDTRSWWVFLYLCPLWNFFECFKAQHHQDFRSFKFAICQTMRLTRSKGYFALNHRWPQPTAAISAAARRRQNELPMQAVRKMGKKWAKNAHWSKYCSTYGSAVLTQATSARTRTGRESSDFICTSWELWRNQSMDVSPPNHPLHSIKGETGNKQLKIFPFCWD